MRIVKEWNNNTWRYTLFRNNLKYSLKIEDERCEQWFKLQDISDFDLDLLMNHMNSDLIIKKTQLSFNSLHEVHSEIMGSFYNIDDEEDDFDEII